MRVTAHNARTEAPYFRLLWGQVERDSGVTAQLLARRLLCDLPPEVPDRDMPVALCAALRALVRYVPERGQVIASLSRLLELGAGDCNDLAPALASLLLSCGWEPVFLLGWTRKPSGGWLGAHLWVGVSPKGVGFEATPPKLLELDPSTYDLGQGEVPSSRYERVTLHRRPQ